MTGLTFIIRGQTVAAHDVAKYATPAKKRTSDGPLKRVYDRSIAKESMGFLVWGYSPEQMTEAKKEHEAALKERDALIESDPSCAANLKAIQPWCADAFMNKAKPKRVRSKPYELFPAAETCKQMAEKAGWLRVTVEEVMKG